MKKQAYRLAKAGVLAGVIVALSGCAATHTMLAKRDLDVQTKMSDTIFLEPVGPDKKTVFVQFRNTSDKPEFSIDPEIRAALEGKGYRLVDDPEQAHYLLQAYILQVGKADPTAAEQAVNAGYGNAGGVVSGASLAYVAGADSGRAIVGAGIVGGAASLVANALVKDVTYSAVTDMQISERIEGTAEVESTHRLKQGSSGTTNVRHQRESNYLRYQSRVLSTANKANLDFEEALPELRKGLVQAVTGVF